MTYTITLQPSGHSFDVKPGQAILAAGLAAGLVMPYSCKTGVCRTCRGKVLDGRVELGNVHAHYLTEADRAMGLALLCQARPLSDVVIEVNELKLASIPAAIVPARVKRIARLADDVAQLELRLPINENMRFAAGQYVDLLLEEGVRRSYSIATAPSPEGVIDLELHIRHLVGGLFTDRLFAGTIRERSMIRFEGPQGTFFLREDSRKPIILLASGTGFAPIKSLLLYAFSRRVNARRPIVFYWGGRRPADLYLRDLVNVWVSAHENFRFVPVLSEAQGNDGWTGRIGLVHRAVLDDFADLSAQQVYACGAPVMVEAARSDFTKYGCLPEDEFFADSFLTQADRMQVF